MRRLLSSRSVRSTACAAFTGSVVAVVSCLTSGPTPPPTSPGRRGVVSDRGSTHPRDVVSAAAVISPTSPMCDEIQPSASRPSPLVPPTASAPSSPVRLGPPTIRCGDVDCDAMTQVCCQINGSLEAAAEGSPQPNLKEPVCARRTAAGVGPTSSEFAQTPWYRQQSEVCARALKDNSSLISVTYCDDSSDCPSGQACSRTHGTCGALTVLCYDWFYVDKCEPLDTLPIETCVPGETCRTPGTACFEGECVLRDTARACGTRTCQPGSVCCWRDRQCYECVARDECKNHFGATQECYSSRDCPAPRRCRAVFEYNTTGGRYYQGSSCETGEVELCKTMDDCQPELDGVRVTDCSYGRLGSDDCSSEPNSPLLGTCVYGN